MSEGARAKPVRVGCLDDHHERADHQTAIVCITCTTNAFAAEQTARAERLQMKVEQYQRQLDDGWSGVTTLVNKEIAARGAAEAQVERLRTALGVEHGELCWGPSCEVCALLADPTVQP